MTLPSFSSRFSKTRRLFCGLALSNAPKSGFPAPSADGCGAPSSTSNVAPHMSQQMNSESSKVFCSACKSGYSQRPHSVDVVASAPFERRLTKYGLPWIVRPTAFAAPSSTRSVSSVSGVQPLSVVRPAASLLFAPFLVLVFFLRVVVAKPAFRGAPRVTARLLVGWKLVAVESASARSSERGIMLYICSRRFEKLEFSIAVQKE